MEEVLFSRTPLWQRNCPFISSWGYGCLWGVRCSKRKENGRVCYLLGFCFERWDVNIGTEDLKERLSLSSKQINNIGLNRYHMMSSGGSCGHAVGPACLPSTVRSTP